MGAHMIEAIFSEPMAYIFGAAGILNVLLTSLLLAFIERRQPDEYEALGKPRVWSNSGGSLLGFWMQLWKRKYPTEAAGAGLRCLCLLVAGLSFVLCVVFPIWVVVGVVGTTFFGLPSKF